MSLKAELETWAAALKAYDEEDFEKSLELFFRIADSSKILTNIGLIYATIGEHEAAVERFIEATRLDQYLAVAYFQCGVSNFLLGRFELAFKDFEEALLYLRDNQAINYEQLGLKFRLFSAEVLFNKGLSLINLGRLQDGLTDMENARQEKATEEHNVIDDAIRDRGEGYTVFSIPVGVLYRPSEKKLKNAVMKDFMGKAKLVASSDPGDTFTTFTGATKLKEGITPAGIYIDRPAESSAPLSRSATAPTVTFPTPDTSVLPSVTRSKTTINVPSNARELTAGKPTAPTSISIGRNNTTISPAMSASNPLAGGPAQGLNINRRPAAASPSNNGVSTAPPAPPKEGNTRLTEFYEDYFDSYGDSTSAPPLPPMNNSGPDRVAAWARSNANPNFAPTRSGSRSAPGSQYAPSYGGGTLRRKVTRRPTGRTQRTQSAYEEEEEGYVSGEYEDGVFELTKIRVKVHYQDDVRGMTLTPETPFDEFMDKITAKFGKQINGLALKFKDEDGGKVTLRDESDYELAIETARESAKGKPEGKLEIWCAEV